MSVETSWQEANQRYLTAALALVGHAVERHAERARAEGAQVSDSPTTAPHEFVEGFEAASAAMPSPPALEILCSRFGLSPFERDVLLLTAGIELDSSFAARCAATQADHRRQPTFSLALAALPEAHWSALLPSGPLRHWRLIELGGGEGITQAPLRIDERVLHFLTGLHYLDERLVSMIRPLPAPVDLVPSHRAIAERIASAWADSSGGDGLPAVQLCGTDPEGKRAIAAAVCAALGLDAHELSVATIPTAPVEVDGLIRLWEREAILSGAALLLDCDDLDANDAARESAVARLTDDTRGPVLVAVRDRRRARRRPLLAFEAPKPTADEQRALWRSALGATAASLNGHVDTLVAQFDLCPVAIRSAGRQVASTPEAADSGHVLWDAARAQARPRLEGLAQRIETTATWDDLVLPEPQKQILREIGLHVRHRAKVYDTWGFATRLGRGLGISALFSGPSGTGKTLAAEVLANELRLDLYRIDLSSVVSKYIGDTEKKLGQVFDAAEQGGGILLFDEADALFGQRTAVRDSHDRYANIEISYLLQRIETYRGLAILTTNLKDALDAAFLRRLRFVVQFSFPDAAQRANIWRRMIPARTPTQDLDIGALAHLAVAGGDIRNISLSAAFLAADEGHSLGMAQLLRAARREYTKAEKPLSEAEIRGWPK